VQDQITFEVCVDSVEAALAAQEGGADRVELCANLLEGGTTPSAATIQYARKSIEIGLHVIIRPRGGDFCYSNLEFEVMKRDVQLAKEWGSNGVVVGNLNEDGTVDTERTGALVSLARPMSITFHRAFDMSRDPYEALERLIELGIDRVLTSGQEPYILDGLDLISELVERAGDRIIVMPGGGGISARNIQRIVEQSRAREIHFAAPVQVESRMRYRNTRVTMGGELRPPEYALAVTDPGQVQRVVHAVRGRAAPRMAR